MTMGLSQNSVIKRIGCQVDQRTYAIRVTYKLEESEKNHRTFVEPRSMPSAETNTSAK
jgi:hypothetical protein